MAPAWSGWQASSSRVTAAPTRPRSRTRGGAACSRRRTTCRPRSAHNYTHRQPDMHARIAGTGSYLPAKVLTNADLEKIVDTTDEWIRSRTGIERRHIAADDETTSSMSTIAAQRAMEAA